METEDIGFVTEGINPNDTPIIKVIGVGGGGGNAVGYMYNLGVENVKFVVANTDLQALKNSPVPERLLLGTSGLGAGNKPEVAAEAAKDSIEAISHLFDDTTKMVFITAGLGGGTGTGAAPIVAKVAKERGILTIGIVTIPFFFEGMKKIQKALLGADEMRKHVDALLLINNEQLIKIYPDLDFDSAFNKADDVLATAARSISELITTRDTRLNLDFNDVDTTLRDGGTAIISCGYGEGEKRVENAIQDALNSPLLTNRDILGSQRLLFNLYYSRNAQQRFKTSEMEAFTDFVNHLPGVDVIYGVAYDETLGDKVKVTILAAGFDISTATGMSAPAPVQAAADFGTPQMPAAEPVTTKHEDDPALLGLIKDQYGADRVAKMKEQHAKNQYIVLSRDQLDDNRMIEILEKYPAYKRPQEIKKQLANPSSAIFNPEPQAKKAEETPSPRSTGTIFNIGDE